MFSPKIRRNTSIVLIALALCVMSLCFLRISSWQAALRRFVCFRSSHNETQRVACLPSSRGGHTFLSGGDHIPPKASVQHDSPSTQKVTTTLGIFTVTKTTIYPTSSATAKPDKAVVVGHTYRENTSWIAEQLPDWQHIIYSVDDPKHALHTVINKGNEALPYLTYIVDHYDNLPSTIAFIHAHLRNDHMDDFLADNAESLLNLQVPYVQQQGYVNLRCQKTVGCPAEIQLNKPVSRRVGIYETNIPRLWRHFFGLQDLPQIIGVQCCAQFAVSKAQVRARPLADYQKYLRWILTTDMEDSQSGRILEHLWHIIFGREPVFCPDEETCSCNVYGLCNGKWADGSTPSMAGYDEEDDTWDPDTGLDMPPFDAEDEAGYGPGEYDDYDSYSAADGYDQNGSYGDSDEYAQHDSYGEPDEYSDHSRFDEYYNYEDYHGYDENNGHDRSDSPDDWRERFGYRPHGSGIYDLREPFEHE